VKSAKLAKIKARMGSEKEEKKAYRRKGKHLFFFFGGERPNIVSGHP
jgi:hypothetical protein